VLGRGCVLGLRENGPGIERPTSGKRRSEGSSERENMAGRGERGLRKRAKAYVILTVDQGGDGRGLCRPKKKGGRGLRLSQRDGQGKRQPEDQAIRKILSGRRSQFKNGGGDCVFLRESSNSSREPSEANSILHERRNRRPRARKENSEL